MPTRAGGQMAQGSSGSKAATTITQSVSESVSECGGGAVAGTYWAGLKCLPVALHDSVALASGFSCTWYVALFSAAPLARACVP